MDKKIKDFENAAIEAVSALRNELGAKRINMEIHIDNYEKGCKTDVTFFYINSDGCVTRSRMRPRL